MGVTIKKAGEVAAKAAASGKLPLRVARAVNVDQVDQIAPAKQSTSTTLMPWKGWFQRWLKEQVGDEKFAKFRSTFFFMPDDIYDLQQSPKPTQKVPISKTDPSITHMYRYPAPGSQAPVREPEFEADEDPYDTGYFKKDTRRRYLSSELGNPELEKLKLELMPDSPLVQEEMKKVEAGPESSPGNKGVFATGPTDFDPSGLRATMSVSWSKLEESLDQHMPDHLPEPTWMGQEAAVKDWYQSRGLPVPVGGYYAALKVPVERRVARW